MVSWASGIHHFLCTETFTHRPRSPPGHTEHIHTGNIYVLPVRLTHTHTHTNQFHPNKKSNLHKGWSLPPAGHLCSLFMLLTHSFSSSSLTHSSSSISPGSESHHTHTHTHTHTHAPSAGGLHVCHHPFILLRVTSCSFLLAVRRCVQDMYPRYFLQLTQLISLFFSLFLFLPSSLSFCQDHTIKSAFDGHDIIYAKPDMFECNSKWTSIYLSICLSIIILVYLSLHPSIYLSKNTTDTHTF